jgi:isopentenyl phosphate kinase
MRTFIKFGGSVITDKTRPEAADHEEIRRLSYELAAALQADPTLQVVLGHGSGSFGHTYARRYGVHHGIAPDGDWMGFAQTAAAALRLNRILVDELLAANVPALSLQPSATLVSEGGVLSHWDKVNIQRALDHGLVPVVHGDVAFDSLQGSAIISTEQLLIALTHDSMLRPERIVLVGEAGVFTADPRMNPDAQRIPRVDGSNIDEVLSGAAGSHGVDVTGGMRSKVEFMWQLVSTHPGMEVQLIGVEPGLLQRALLGQAEGEGTTIGMRA